MTGRSKNMPLNISWEARVLMLLLALYPLLGWYGIPFPVPLGGTLMLFFSALVIVRSGFKINVFHWSFWIMFLYVCGMWCWQHGFALWTIFPPGGWIFFQFCMSLIACTITFNVSLLKKYMGWVVWISIILFWVQYVLLHATGHNICLVPNLTGQFSYEGMSYAELAAWQRSLSHPCAIFLEKSYMAYYLGTYLTLKLFGPEQRYGFGNGKLWAIVITLVFLQSGSGMVFMAIMLLVKFFAIIMNGNKTRNILLLGLCPLLIASAYYVYANTEIGEEMIERQEEFSVERSSGYDRVIGGYIMFATQNTKEQLWGTDRSQLADDYGRNKEGDLSLYVNGFQTVLLTLGCVGAILYILFYGFLFHKVTTLGRMCIVLLLIMSLIESCYLNTYMLLLTAIPCALLYNGRHKRLFSNYKK